GLGGVIGCEARSAADADTSHILRRVGRWWGLSRVRPRGGGRSAPWPYGHFLYLSPTFSAAFCAFSSALSTVVRPAMAELTSSEMPVARSANSGIVTNCTPSVGRGWRPGFSGSAELIASSVCL